MARQFVKKGDIVQVISGPRPLRGRRGDRGKTGKVLRVFPKDQLVLIESINMRKKHVRPNPQKNIKGGIIEREFPIHWSKVKVVQTSD
ncbi:MAG: 50S ribosomal protein L24 [Candidatus Omnitrophica bacterium]|nr:50S ribosomal protein L24 [bacterium]NUN97468.1 50S ribosomal protein L24 [Candidatus Omnitrophota bacterium]